MRSPRHWGAHIGHGQAIGARFPAPPPTLHQEERPVVPGVHRSPARICERHLDRPRVVSIVSVQVHEWADDLENRWRPTDLPAVGRIALRSGFPARQLRAGPYGSHCTTERAMKVDQYDLGRLTDFDFELVCKDIFEETLGLALEVFAPGADEGVDLRHLAPSDHAVVIQCKHWARAGRNALLRHMKNNELTKVQRLSPGRYILATTAELNKNAKDKIYKDFSPYMISPSDCFGVHEVSSILNNNGQIVRKHLRLWLNSTAVLQSLLNKEIIVRSESLADEVRETLRVYVNNGSHDFARTLLDEQNLCIIAGVPGIGKTTLAQVLVAEHVAVGYELIEVSEDIEEANRLWDDVNAQIFYYDDFLGQTSLADKLHKNEDSRLLKFMRRISAKSNKKLVMTTREYILAQAKQRYERLELQNFRR